MKKIPFRIIIYILKFHALELNIDKISHRITDYKFKVDKLFGYFKLDKWRKIFKLYEYLSFVELSNYIYASIFVSIKFKPSIIGCIINDINYQYNYSVVISQLFFNTVMEISSLKWIYVLPKYRTVILISPQHIYIESNIVKLKLMCFAGDINIKNYPKLKYIYVNCISDKHEVCLIGFKDWKGILKTDTPKWVYII